MVMSQKKHFFHHIILSDLHMHTVARERDNTLLLCIKKNDYVFVHWCMCVCVRLGKDQKLSAEQKP